MFKQFLGQIKRSFIIVKKDVRIYYLKGPVVIFGLVFPLFLFLAYYIGRNISLQGLAPGLLSMTLFFASTAVTPPIIPWESRSKTLERLVSTPLSLWAMILGDIVASSIFGFLISIIPVLIALWLGVKALNLLFLLVSMVLASLCFSSLGLLLSAYPPTDVPATTLMLSSLVKFPLIFVSGVFIPVEEMPAWGRRIALLSPLTYFTDLSRYSFHLSSYLNVHIDLTVLVAFTFLFLFSSIKLHKATIPKRL